MSRLVYLMVALALAALTLAPVARAASAAEFGAAYQAATRAEQQAARLRNRWTTTEATLKAAQEAADRKDYDKAVALARRAEALAKVSIAQAKEQKRLWRNVVVK
jgi:hypothetical protein